MTIIDHSTDDDQKAMLAHRVTDAHVKALRIANGWTRAQVFEHLAAYMENDEEAPLTPVAPINLKPPRKRARRPQEARAHG